MSVTVDVSTGRVTADGADALTLRRRDMRASPAQIRRALHRLGRLAEVDTIAQSDPEAAILWEYATVMERQSPFVAALGAASFTPDEIDAIFDLAVTM